MIKNKKIIYTCLIILILIFIIIFFGIKNNKFWVKTENNLVDEQNLEENSLIEQSVEKVEEIKNEIGITGNTELYEIQKGYDDKEIAVIKPNIKYKVAFAGMIKKQKPEMNELDNIIETNHPKNNGIWIENNSREKMLKIIKNNTKSTYKIDDDGYLKIINKNMQNDNDIALEKIINSNKLFILNISSICYIIDDISGEILDFNFEKLDMFQNYEYFTDENRNIIFITENSKNILDETEIFQSLLNLMFEQVE